MLLSGSKFRNESLWTFQIGLNFKIFFIVYALDIGLCLVNSVVSDSLQPHGLEAHQAPLSMEFSRQEY